jgi:hypothetical protein
MNGILNKLDNGWMLLIDKVIYATDNDKLSIKNCQDIENGYDLDELASEFAYGQSPEDSQESFAKFAFIEGFQKAMELMDGKKYSEDDIQNVIDCDEDLIFQTVDEKGEIRFFLDEEVLSKSLQPKEWEVEIEQELDKDGCLILRKL